MSTPSDKAPYTKSLNLRNFTVFTNAKFNFVAGVNAFIGENGTGKTHLMKALYAMYYAQSRNNWPLDEVIQNLFQTKNVRDTISMDATGVDATAEVSGAYGSERWKYEIARAPGYGPMQVRSEGQPSVGRPVFIPAIDMMGHTRGFTEAYADIRLDFDLTCSDIVNLLRLESRSKNGNINPFINLAADVLGGTIDRDDSGRFYLVTSQGRMPMPMVAEGLRKVATLIQLQQNGWLSPGSTLFWDEPEVNLNPVLMDNVVAAILKIARSGVQVFLATHSYLILREIEVQATKSDIFRYFSLLKSDTGVEAHPADSYLDIRPNSIERHYSELYDRGLDKRLATLDAVHES